MPFPPNFASTKTIKSTNMKAMMMLICMLLVQGMAMASNRINGRVVDDNDASPLIGATGQAKDKNEYKLFHDVSF